MEDHNPKAVKLFNNNAVLYEQKYMDVSMYANSLDTFCNALNNENASILELACGPGNVTKYILDKHPDFQILATDLAPQMLELAKWNCPSATIQSLDARKIIELEQQFNGIICAFGFPYLSKEEVIQLITESTTKLNSKGVVYLSTMEDVYTSSKIQSSSTTGEELFMYFHEAGYLKDALTHAGFSILLEERIYSKDNSNKEVVDLILIAQLKQS